MTKAIDIVFRVVRLPNSLRQSMRAARDTRNQTNEVFIAKAVTANLPTIIGTLGSLGFCGANGTEPDSVAIFRHYRDVERASDCEQQGWNTGYQATRGMRENAGCWPGGQAKTLTTRQAIWKNAAAEACEVKTLQVSFMSARPLISSSLANQSVPIHALGKSTGRNRLPSSEHTG